MISDDFLRITSRQLAHCVRVKEATVDQIDQTSESAREQMPFANLPIHEKDAFFALLDE